MWEQHFSGRSWLWWFVFVVVLFVVFRNPVASGDFVVTVATKAYTFIYTTANGMSHVVATK